MTLIDVTKIYIDSTLHQPLKQYKQIFLKHFVNLKNNIRLLKKKMKNSDDSIVLSSRRKSTVWTREKIAQLIELYRQHDCLWNHYTEAYKNKEKRTKAIDDICNSLHITKLEFGKKIHNLRNQFNSEMKKLERRVEETGDDTESTAEGCRWKHFQSLRFLQDVIEPRPGGYQAKKIKISSNLKYDNSSEEETKEPNYKASKARKNDVVIEQITEYQFDDATIVDNSAVISEHTSTDRSMNFNEHGSENIISTLGAESESNHFFNSPKLNQRLQNVNHADINKTSKILDKKSDLQLKPQSQEDPIEEPQTGQTNFCCHNFNAGMQYHKNILGIGSKQIKDKSMFIRSRDEWDAFGELIATEFRNLNSVSSKKKLKRKIMQAMLEIGEEDDSTSGCNY
ncbi:uncharacterized protein [Bactrocera oleae]|uniref:uncharacterized protein n=1 Tax=Bactrocera oleae TaxID=104688 RepID=UPI0006B743B6|nr:uncharacterized protein LOC106621352 [Bactrocera oleae]